MGSDQKRAILAVILSGIVLFSWQAFFAPKVTPVAPKTVANTANVAQAKPVVPNNIPVAVATPAAVTEVTKFELNRDTEKAVLDNSLSLSDFSSRYSKLAFEDIVGSTNAFQVVFIDERSNEVPQLFSGQVDESGKWVGTSADGTKITWSLGEDGRLHFSLNSATAKRLRFLIRSSEAQLGAQNIRNFLFFTKDVVRESVGSNETSEGSTKWFGLDFNYHLFAVILPERKTMTFRSYESGLVEFDLAKPVTIFEASIIYAQKDYDVLHTLGDKLDLSVDFGIFGILAVPILRGLQFFYKYVPNYGIAIILLTLVIRLITFPLQYKSFKSMKKMQKVQPEIANLREKFKDDPQRMQRETMELFKRAGANPLGGCLPLILQMPVFFAFYQVLYNAVELVGAPFFGWIADLSIKDPFYILPVLMAVAMFLQQRVTPTTVADPTQKKIMTFMPIIFGFIMKDLPSGLVLYIFISTLFGMAQQMFVYKTVD
ncbi:MAG: hypothetical protein CME71_02440 [Halobacteriovorax sp.]|nr:hypothetical protein [Halobacteriovorax sp.]